MKHTLASAVAAWFVLLLPTHSFSGTWHITVDGSGDAPTIQAAVDASSDGDTILVGPGTYTWTNQGTNSAYGMVYVQRGQDRLVIRSELGPQATILDGQFIGRVLFIQGWNYLTLEGFTIRNGIGMEQGYFVGGGLTMHLSYEVVRNCIFEENNAVAGGAVWVGGVSAPQFIDCEFRNNTAERGGAVYLINSSSTPQFRGCRFHHNSASGAGGAIRAVHCGFIIENSIFAFNICGTQGGAIVTQDAWACRLTACTIAQNSAGEGGSFLYALTTPDIRVERCVVAFGIGGAPYTVADASGLVVSCTDTFGNSVSDALPAGAVDGGGNFSLDPQFCGPPGSMNYHLSEGSPCVVASGPCGVMGALGTGCGSVRVEPATWGRVKAFYR